MTTKRRDIRTLMKRGMERLNYDIWWHMHRALVQVGRRLACQKSCICRKRKP